ncbi:hypothetical protein IVB33_17605 [Bradyrhizobium sp. 24]|uniref:hypothetical protein n=1 Tax=unclassified Bradyrhizobium TaxID=2631580 RepID=UPI001FF81D3F|nr:MULTISPECIES: hypothetical protein [unclassified Bradyrhizobium]MCK1303871.1 hypothetical protein [Bradyrhizobium sp. 37]MCK1379412.1 hypothetical protein [Bradyrhizobium sp. 24]MCK1770389.1 hypothetical protein [Bradyrhizobium sp. 134]
MADVEAAVRELVERDRDCTEKALAQMDLRRKINLLIGEWKAAGGGDVLPNVRDRMRLRSANTSGSPLRVIARR